MEGTIYTISLCCTLEAMYIDHKMPGNFEFLALSIVITTEFMFLKNRNGDHQEKKYILTLIWGNLGR